MSHNTMASFFSGTDLSTLQEEGTEQNHFCSLIINNAGVYTAAITRRVKGVRHTVTDGAEILSYKSFGDEEKVINNKPIHSEATSNVEYLEYYMLDIEIESVQYERNSLDVRLDELQSSADSYINRNKVTKIAPNVMSTKPVQRNLFGEVIEEKPATVNPIKAKVEKELEEGLLDYNAYHIEEAMVTSHVKQLLTLNLFAGNNPKVDVKQWGENLTTIIPRRFPNDTDYTYVMETFIDALYTELPNSELYALLGDEATAAIWANDIVAYFEDHIARNHYTNIIINSIERWLI